MVESGEFKMIVVTIGLVANLTALIIIGIRGGHWAGKLSQQMSDLQKQVNGHMKDGTIHSFHDPNDPFMRKSSCTLIHETHAKALAALREDISRLEKEKVPKQ